jgi:hypothetical protein
MRKPGKKKFFVGSRKGPYVFVVYKDGKGIHEQDEGNMTYIIKDMDNKR